MFSSNEFTLIVAYLVKFAEFNLNPLLCQLYLMRTNPYKIVYILKPNFLMVL